MVEKRCLSLGYGCARGNPAGEDHDSADEAHRSEASDHTLDLPDSCCLGPPVEEVVVDPTSGRVTMQRSPDGDSLAGRVAWRGVGCGRVEDVSRPSSILKPRQKRQAGR